MKKTDNLSEPISRRAPNSKSVKERIGQFCDLVRQGIEAWEKAGALLVALLEEDPNVFEKIIANSVDGLKHEHLLTFERIGRKQLYPRLLLDESYPAKRVLDLGLSFDQQVALCDRPIKVAVARNDEIVTQLKRLNELTRSEAVTVIGEDGARSIAEQSQILIDRKARDPVRYRIDGDHVVFFALSTFTRAQLEEIIQNLPQPSALDITASIQANQIRA
jgi:hypothetical protein